MFVTKIGNSSPYPDGDPFHQTTPTEIDDGVRALCHDLGGLQAVFLPVTPAPGAETGMCHDNVTDQIARYGGGRAFGWAIWTSQLFALAEFHEVWVSPTGELIEITPAAEGESLVAFAMDAKYASDFDFMRHPPNRVMRTIERPWNTDVDDLMEALSPAQRIHEESRAKRNGQDLASHLFGKIQPSPLAETLDALFEAWAVRDSLVVRTTSGNFSPDPKAYRIAQSKALELDDLVERLLAERPAPHVFRY